MKPADLDIKVDPHFDKLNHRFERIAWALLTLFLISAGVGLFGQSKFSWKKIAFDNTAFHYSKFVRREAPSELRLEVADAKDIVRVWIANKYLETLQIDTVNPVPTESMNSGEGVEYQFKSRGGALNIVFEMTPQNVGKLEGEFSVNDSPKQSFTQYSYF